MATTAETSPPADSDLSRRQEASAAFVNGAIFQALLHRAGRLSAMPRVMREPVVLFEWTPRDLDAVDGLDDDEALFLFEDGGGGGFGAVPASGVAVACLPATTAGGCGDGEEEEKNEECAVCLEPYAPGDALRTLPCSHGFHESCIFGWLCVSRLCPLCRFAMPAEDDEEG